MSEPTKTPVEIIAEVLRAEGEIHGSWRCEYPEQYGPCSCFEGMAELIAEALIEADALVIERMRAENTGLTADADLMRYAARVLLAEVERLRAQAVLIDAVDHE